MYIDGTSVSSVTKNTFFSIGNTSNGIRIGAYPYIPGGAKGFSGYIDDVRITVGLACYNSNFTPPAAAFSYYPHRQIKFVPKDATVNAGLSWQG